MKRISVVLISVMFLAACGSPSKDADVMGSRFEGYSKLESAEIVKDAETGCKYLYIDSSYGGSLSPLYKADGNIDCDK